MSAIERIERRMQLDPELERRMQLDLRERVKGMLFFGWTVVNRDPLQLQMGNRLATVDTHWTSYETPESATGRQDENSPV